MVYFQLPVIIGNLQLKVYSWESFTVFIDIIFLERLVQKLAIRYRTRQEITIESFLSYSRLIQIIFADSNFK